MNEVGEAGEQSIGIGTVNLVISPESRVVEQARSLIDRVRQEIADELIKEEFLQLIETILFYKLPNMGWEEIQAMFELSDLKQTKVYQEALQEGKLLAVPHMLALGASVEQVAEALGLSIEEVRQVARNQTSE